MLVKEDVPFMNRKTVEVGDSYLFASAYSMNNESLWPNQTWENMLLTRISDNTCVMLQNVPKPKKNGSEQVSVKNQENVTENVKAGYQEKAINLRAARAYVNQRREPRKTNVTASMVRNDR